MTSDPGAMDAVTLGEVYRISMRIDGRLDQMSRDMIGRQEYESDHEALTSSIKALHESLAQERRDRIESISAIQSAATAGKRWAIATAVSGGALMLGVVGFVLDMGGGPTA